MNYRDLSVKIISSLLTIFLIYIVYYTMCLFSDMGLINNYFWIGTVIGSVASDIYYLKKGEK